MKGMMKKTACVGIVVGLLAGAWYLRAENPSEHGQVPRDEWQLGEQRSYSVHLHIEDEIALPDASGAIWGATDLDGDVSIRYEGKVGGNRIFAWTLRDISSLDVHALGERVPVPSGSLLDHPLLIEVDDAGKILDYHVDAAAPDVSRNLLRLIASEAQLISGQHNGTVAEPAFHGRAQTRFELDGRTVEKVRLDYETLASAPWHSPGRSDQDLDSEFAFTLDDAGRMHTLVGHEELEVFTPDGNTAFESQLGLRLELLEATIVTAPSPAEELEDLLAARQAYAAEQVFDSKEATDQALAARVGDMTWPRLETWLSTYDGDPSNDPSFSKRIWNATGLLTQRPELCHRMTGLLLRASTDKAQRELGFSLLASVGHADAQASLVQVLDSDELRGDTAAYVGYLQLAVAVKAPGEDLERLVTDRMEHAASRDEHLAAAYSLGSIAREAAAAGHPARAAAAREHLLAELAEARDPADQAQYLRALSNTAAPENVEVASRFADAENWDVRSAAAESLYDVKTPEAQRLLDAFAGDPNHIVQATALRTLRRFEPSELDPTMIRDHLLDGRVDSASMHHLAAYAARLPRSPERDEILEYLIANAGSNPGVRDRAAKALRR